MGLVMSALAAATAACGCFNTAFDCIGKCCGRTKPEQTPQGNSTNLSTRDGDATAINNSSDNQVEYYFCNCFPNWRRQKTPQAYPSATDSPGMSIGVQNVVGGSQFITVGLWGDLNVGHSFKHKGFDGIKTVKVCSSDSGIHSIEVQYTKDGKDAEKVKEGSNDGCAQEQCSYNEEVIVLQHGEYINNVQGYYGPYLEDKRIRSLTFTTNTRRPFGPYGEKVKRGEKNTRFFVTEGRIVGFYGKASSYISAIGFYVLPQLNASGKEEQLIEVGFWGKRTPQSFKHWGYEGIKALKINHGAVIDRIEVEYRNEDKPYTEGGLGGDKTPKQIVFEDGEYINKVIGHYGNFKLNDESPNFETINQLTFTTNKTDKNTKKPRVLGPYGYKLETYDGKTFATKFRVKGGRIVGFRGTGGRYISSIGFYILP